jgi:hypothetical protein
LLGTEQIGYGNNSIRWIRCWWKKIAMFLDLSLLGWIYTPLLDRSRVKVRFTQALAKLSPSMYNQEALRYTQDTKVEEKKG